MSRIDDLENQMKDRTSRQTSLHETLLTINGRLVHVERNQKHLIETMNSLDLSIQEAVKAFHMYQGVLRFLHAENFSLEKLKDDKQKSRSLNSSQEYKEEPLGSSRGGD